MSQPRKSRSAAEQHEHTVLVCPVCSRLVWPRALLKIIGRPRSHIFGFLIRGKRGGGWKTVRVMTPNELPPIFSMWKQRLLFAVQAWRGLGWIVDADFAFVGQVTTISRPVEVESRRDTWSGNRVVGAIGFGLLFTAAAMLVAMRRLLRLSSGPRRGPSVGAPSARIREKKTVAGLAFAVPGAGTVWARFTRPEGAPTSFLGPLRAAFCPKIGDPAKLTR
jgi:hypothetical protein